MRKTKTYFTTISLLLTLIFSLSLFSFSVGAVDEGESAEPEAVTEAVTDAQIEDETIPPEEPMTEAPTEEPYVETEPETDEYIEDVTEEEEIPTEYTEPEHLEELPSVTPEEIMLATEMDLPDVIVSDTTTLGGVVAWLCVAVGIAVIVGVMMSKRVKNKTR